MFLPLHPPNGVAYPLAMVEEVKSGLETLLFGKALRALRRRAGMTLESAGQAFHTDDGEGISGAAFSRYERGEAVTIHQPETLDRLLTAIQANRDEFQREIELLGGAAANGLAESGAQFAAPPAGFVIPVSARSRPDAQRGGMVYDVHRADGSADLAWLFAPSTGHLRMADDRLKGRIKAGQLLHYDRTMPPAEGQVCVIEAGGVLHVYEYKELAGGKVTVTQRNPAAEILFDLKDVRGVYAVRMCGD